MAIGSGSDVGPRTLISRTTPNLWPPFISSSDHSAGKSTYARDLARRSTGVHLAIDDWMGQLFGPDLPQPMEFASVMERVRRCEHRIWSTATAVARVGTPVVLDLGFLKVASRAAYMARATAEGHGTQLHFVTAAPDVRRARVLARNVTKGETFAFDVTPAMFDFMEREFEPPTEHELASACVVEAP